MSIPWSSSRACRASSAAPTANSPRSKDAAGRSERQSSELDKSSGGAPPVATVVCSRGAWTVDLSRACNRHINCRGTQRWNEARGRFQTPAIRRTPIMTKALPAAADEASSVLHARPWPSLSGR
eukprot:3076195-Prymnesium_polylepis.1